MSDTDTQEKEPKKKLSLARPGKLEIKKTIEGGQVRQSFSHGRSKVVAVEVRKKRTFAPGAGGAMREVRDAEAEAAFEGPAPAEAVEAAPVETRAVPSEQHLTQHERQARAKALQEARRAEEERQSRAELEEQNRALEDDETRRQREDEDKRRAEAEARRTEEDSRHAEEAEMRRRAEQGEAAAIAGIAKLKQHAEEGVVAEEDEESEAARAKRGKVAPKRPPVRTRGEPRRRSGKLTITEALDENERVRSLASMRRAREKQKKKEAPTDRLKVVREVTVPETITVNELANRMAERGVEVIKILMKMGVMATLHQAIDADTAELVATEFGHRVKRVTAGDVEIGLGGGEDTESDLAPRSPVVTVMGHVDHGKTSLLDAIRQADVAAGEAGGITQHIGAYRVETAGGTITFIDTPGHEAFTAMRARGARVTDIVVLVVAADDGIMPQTVEAIAHAKAAGVPIIVAINKIDKPDANPTRARTQLLEHEIVVESMGGDVQDVEVSATKKTNLDKLLDAILLQAEVLDLKANPDRVAEGVVIESKIEGGRGAVATVLIQRGTLTVGDIFVAGAESGRVRTLTNDRGEAVTTAGPSEPVEVTGLAGAPAAGDVFVVVDSEQRAREVAAFRQGREQKTRNAIAPRGTLEEMFTQIRSGEMKELPVVIKGDVQGSVEAISGMLAKLPQAEVKIRLLHTGVGGINESDVALASATSGIVIGFNVRANKDARDEAARSGVDIRYYSVIYDIGDDIKKMLVGLMKPEIRETFLGNAEVLQVFNISKVGKVAGCRVNEGVVRRGAKVRLLRDNVVIHEGKLSTLKHFKDEVREVRQGSECGMSFEAYNDLKEHDVIECFDVQEIAPTL